MVYTEQDIPPALKQRVEDVIRKCVLVAETHFNRHFSCPQVRYDLKGKTAGIANSSRNLIRLHPTILLQNQDDYLHRTVPHEIAHIIADCVYPSGYLDKRKKSAKIPHHGTGWQYVMSIFGLPPEVYHKYDVSAVVSRPRYQHTCSHCKQIVELTVKQAATVRTKPKSIFHVKCGPSSTFTPVDETNIPLTKFHKCEQLYLAFRTATRAELIQLFVKHAPTTAAGAATYYATLRKKYDC